MKKLLFLIAILLITIITILCVYFQFGKLPTVRLITNEFGVDTNSLNAEVWKGIVNYYDDDLETQKKRGKWYDVVKCSTQTEYAKTIEQEAEKGYDLIIATGIEFADAMTRIAAIHPTQKFLLLDANWAITPNLQEYMFAEEQGSFLVGALTALKAIEDEIDFPQFGFIGTIQNEISTKYEAGYFQGIQYIMPHIPVEALFTHYTNDETSPIKAQEQAKNWYDLGMYAIYSDSERINNGIIEQAKEYRAQGKNVWAIGANTDQHILGIYDGEKSAVLTSMIKNVTTIVNNALHDVKENTFNPTLIELDVKTNGVNFSKTNKDEISNSIINKIDTFKTHIISCEIKVKKTNKGAN